MAIDYERSRADLDLKSIVLDFGEIAYLDNNVKSDTTIVLLHGFGGDKDVWNRFSAELDGARHIVVPDLPGHGGSVSNKSLNYSISHQAKMLSIFLKSIGVNKAHLIGNSMGGAVAIIYTNSNPEKVKSLSLIDALGLKKTKSEFDLMIEESGSNPMLNVCTEEAYENLIYLGMHNPPYIPSFFIDFLVSRKCERTDIEKFVYAQMIQDSDLSEIVKNIAPPTIII
ncbi:MAG: alpha/beta fold hydrolase [Ectothiorhodospiraceae bacterium]|nr:alpha/beta fold hydrolase [Ectothiorhodospiraceae bacterium]